MNNETWKKLAMGTLLSILILSAKAQTPSGSKEKDNVHGTGGQKAPIIRYMLPDGRMIGPDKMDSIRQQWGPDRVMTRHNEQDDSKGIIHLERMSDETMKELTASADSQTQGLKAMIGKPAKDFTANDFKGKPVTLSSLTGKVIVINFWFTTCPPCIKEMPLLNQLVKKYAGQNVVFLGITFNDVKTVQGFLVNHPFNYRLITKGNEAIKAYGIHNYPTHLIIGKDGRVKAFFESGENIEALIAKAIAQAS